MLLFGEKREENVVGITTDVMYAERNTELLDSPLEEMKMSNDSKK